MDDLDRLMDKVLGPETAEICRQELPWLRGSGGDVVGESAYSVKQADLPCASPGH